MSATTGCGHAADQTNARQVPIATKVRRMVFELVMVFRMDLTNVMAFARRGLLRRSKQFIA
jgi:hypothetical protein